MVRKEDWIITKTGNDQNLYVCCVCEHKCSILFPQKPDFCVCNLLEAFHLVDEILNPDEPEQSDSKQLELTF
jgi:hypothetical protein